MRAYKVVDVFTAVPLGGNPVAVVLDVEGLSEAQMRGIAAWTNLSETTFCLPPTEPGADYRLRIFTPRSELPFAGHPTLGSAHALIEAGRVVPKAGVLVQQCAVGLVRVLSAPEGLRFELPEARISALSEAETVRLTALLGAPLKPGTGAALVNVGPSWVVAELADAEAVLALRPDLGEMARFEQGFGATGVTVFGRHAQGAAEVEVRSFAPSDGTPEDPVCGSGNGAVAALRRARGELVNGASYQAAQGRCLGRDGRVQIALAQGKITVGGAAVTVVEGVLALE